MLVNYPFTIHPKQRANSSALGATNRLIVSKFLTNQLNELLRWYTLLPRWNCSIRALYICLKLVFKAETLLNFHVHGKWRGWIVIHVDKWQCNQLFINIFTIIWRVSSDWALANEKIWDGFWTLFLINHEWRRSWFQKKIN